MHSSRMGGLVVQGYTFRHGSASPETMGRESSVQPVITSTPAGDGCGRVRHAYLSCGVWAILAILPP